MLTICILALTVVLTICIMYKRILYKPIESGYSFFLLGPRGTGKQTGLETC